MFGLSYELKIQYSDNLKNAEIRNKLFVVTLTGPLIALLLLATSGALLLPHSLSCRSSRHVLSCRAAPLRPQPTALNSSVLQLIRHLQIRNVPLRISRLRPDLTALLTSLPALQTLDLRESGLRSLSGLHSAPLDSLPVLKTADLSSNHLDAVELSTLVKYFGVVKRLILSNCSLVSLRSPSGLVSARWLQLDLSHNLFDELDVAQLLTIAPSIRSLDLSHNRLQWLKLRPSTNVTTPFALLHLKLSHNRLVSLMSPDLPSLGTAFGSLRRLTIDNNPLLTTIDLSSLTAAFPAMERLSLASCRVLAALQSSNQISSPALAHLHVPGCPRLRRIDLSHLPQLETLNISGSGTEAVEGVTRMVQLYADETWAWHCDCRVLWVLQSPEREVRTRLARAFCRSPASLSQRSLASLLDSTTSHLLGRCVAPRVKMCDEKGAQLLAGKRGRLQCRFEGQPRPVVVWKTPEGELIRSRWVLTCDEKLKKPVLTRALHFSVSWVPTFVAALSIIQYPPMQIRHESMHKVVR